MGVEVKVKDIDRSDEVARAIEQALHGPPFEVKDWYELNRGCSAAAGRDLQRPS